jgi:hypothetical protein
MSNDNQLMLPADALDHFREAAADGMRGSFLGTLLRFVKGQYLYGSEKRQIVAGTKLIAVMGEARRGWVRWENKRTTKHAVGRIADGFKPPDRHQLGDTDEADWPSPNGRPADPWQFTWYLPLRSAEVDQLFTFATTSDGGISAVAKLLGQFANQSARHSRPRSDHRFEGWRIRK